MKNLNNKTYNTILSETADFFSAQGVSIIGKGYEEIATSGPLFESYVEMLTEGADANSAAQMTQLMVNTNSGILKESSMTGIAPISSLSMPVIRKLWPKFALKDAIETEVAKTPRFSVLYTRPYLQKGDEKIYIPYGYAHSNEHGEGKTHDHSPALSKSSALALIPDGESNIVNEPDAVDSKNGRVKVTVGAGKAVAVEFDTEVTTTSAIKKQPLDNLVIISVNNKAPGKRLDVTGSGIFDIAGGQLIVKFDGANRKATFAAIGGDAVVVVRAEVSSEYNEDSYSIALDIQRQDIDIPTGQHINAPLPIEALNDMMALYQIDGTKEVVDLMTNHFAMKLDIEILDFLKRSLANRPNNVEFGAFGDPSDFVLTFDCKPAVGFAGSPKAWREELKPLIDHLAQKIKNETYLHAGTFSIVANPIDVQLLANVDWSFRGGQGGNIDGVDVDYSTGTYVGANAYKVIASQNVPAGAMYIVFIPSNGTQMTYKYYPYTFSTETGYIDPNRSRVPSIMMTARRTCYEFMPAIGAIIIANNGEKAYRTINDGTYYAKTSTEAEG